MKLSRRCRVYDSGGKTVDHYTIVTISKPFYSFFSSSNPYHPQGVWSASEDPRPIDEHKPEFFGRRISSAKLPAKVIEAVNSYCKED